MGYFPGVIKLGDLDGVSGYQIADTPEWYANFGEIVRRAGDLDGDGTQDFLIISSTENENAGVVHIFYGSVTPPPGGVYIAPDNLHGDPAFPQFGPGVRAAGDVNLDGFDDLYVEHPFGVAHIMYGGSGGLPNQPVTPLANGFMLGAEVFEFPAENYEIGDINADGFNDFNMGTYVLYGNGSVTPPDVDPANLDGRQGFRLEGVWGTGPSITMGLGDVNGDGVDDMLVGNFGYNFWRDGIAPAYVVYGRSGLITSGTGAADRQDGGAGYDQLAGADGNDFLSGMAADDLLEGGDGNDKLFGGEGRDGLFGGAGNDVLDGGAGVDYMAGGTGDDTYVVDWAGDEFSGQLGDQIFEAAGEGTDRVRATVTYTLGDNLENLVLEGTAAIDGTGNALANLIDGNSANNILSGGGGADLLRGGDGADQLFGGADNDQLVGGSGIDYLFGEDGDDRLSGGAAYDYLEGGAGNDILDGGDAGDEIFGNAGADQLLGGVGDDYLAGGDGNDVLNGGTGADEMIGGEGNDTYFVDDLGDTTLELAAGGYDTVRATISWILDNEFERLTMDGANHLNGTGNALDNQITGNDGDNVLRGMDGSDILKGGLGDDVLVGGTGNDILLGGGGADTFVVLQESISLSTGPGQVLETDNLSDLNTA